jgi:hypothetical protein
MLLGEQERLNQSDFTTLLSNESFNKSLIACSVETVLFAFNCKDYMDIVELLQKFQLQPFDFCKIIESFVLHANWVWIFS